MVERQSGKMTNILRPYGGGEYNSKEFDFFSTSQCIIHEVTPPYTYQHNGLAERRKISFLNMALNMSKYKNLPHEF